MLGGSLVTPSVDCLLPRSPVHPSHKGASHQGLGICSRKRGWPPEQPVRCGIAGESSRSRPAARPQGCAAQGGALGSWLCSLGQVLSPSELQLVVALTSKDCFSAVHEGLAFYAFIQKYSSNPYRAVDTVLGTGATAVDKGPSLWTSHSSGSHRRLST